MVTKERFEQGLTLQQYVEHMSVNRERFVDALDEATIGPADAQILERLPGARHVLVISEDWCGTCLAHVPFVARLVDGRPDIELRLFPRDANLDLMDQYLKRGQFRSIPVFAFFDEQMNELARFLEVRPS
jgi:hypothetical protein